jgi:hypothetical protein
MNLLLLIIVLIILFGGGLGFYSGHLWGGPSIGLGGILLIVVIVLLVTGRL